MEIYSIGRSDTDIILEDSGGTVSKRHAELTVSKDAREYYLVDCGSSNGTFIQRQGRWERISQEIVQPEDRIRFGSSNVRLQDVLRRLPERHAHQTVYFETPQNRTSLQPYRNPESGEIEFR